jgi:phosphate transport system protein
MRAVYHERLSELSHKLGEMSGLTGSATGRATQALLVADLSLAQRVITDHEQIAACRGYEIRPASVTLSGPASAARHRCDFRPPRL